jgi:hypothetical protein
MISAIRSAADSKFERIWLPLIADGGQPRILRTLVAVAVRLCSLETVRVAVRVAVKVAVESHCALQVRLHTWLGVNRE